MTELAPKPGPTFSVIIPVYNKEQYVSRAIQSVLEQSYSHFECIVVDDGSTDRSIDVVRSFRDSRIRLVSKANGGVSSARNMGIMESIHAYLAFLDADDYWSPEYLKNMANLIDRWPSRGLYHSSHVMVQPKGDAVLREAPELAGNGESVVFNLFDYFARTQSYTWALHTSCCVLDKAVVLKVGGFDERISFYEDYDLFSRIALQLDFVYLNKPLSFYCGDVPAEQRLTGKHCEISRHWVNYILQGSLSRSPNNRVQYFAQNFAVLFLEKYRRDPNDRDRAAKIRKMIRPHNLSARALFLHYCPTVIVDSLRNIKYWLRGDLKK